MEKKGQHDKSLLELVRKSSSGAQITINDISEYCSDIIELGECIKEAYKRNIKMYSEQQAWFSMNAPGESPMITIIRLAQLQKEMDKKHEKTAPMSKT